MAKLDLKAGHSRDTLHDGGDHDDDPTHGPAATMGALARVEVEAPHEDDDDDEVDPFGDLGPGSHVGRRYVVEGRLGKGATGVVFVASHLIIGKRVALKCLYPQHRATRISVERFFREAKIAASLEHPNVIEVFDGGDEDGVLFLAMELLEGESLGDRLERGPMPIAEACETFLGIMDGVAAVHDKGVIHRDLKPDNIFLVKARPGRLGGPKVLDFGISKLKEPGLRELTTLGTVMGTPFYMAPEQVANTRDVDARADVYSLGVMLYEALIGEVPYAEESVIDIFRRAQEGDAAPLHRLRADVPGSLARLVEKAMRPNRDDRFASVSEMRDALASVLTPDTDPATLRPAPPEERATIRDMPSPVLAIIAARDQENAETPKQVESHPAVERATVPLHKPVFITETPKWVWLALAASVGMTMFSFLVALIALLW